MVGLDVFATFYIDVLKLRGNAYDRQDIPNHGSTVFLFQWWHDGPVSDADRDSLFSYWLGCLCVIAGSRSDARVAPSHAS